jgi:hypothetical protein
MSTQAKLLKCSRRWFTLPEQVRQNATINRYRHDEVRFKTVHAGRRSFKTEIAKRTLVTDAMSFEKQRLFFGAPTREQAKRIAWEDIKLLSLPLTIAHSEVEMWVRLVSGSEIWVIGFDKPERFEGTQWNGGILDEFGNMKPTVWNENVSPALLDTGGWCWLIGVPEGKNHYYDLSQYAKNEHDPEWKDYAWLTSEVLDPDEVEKERGRLDERTFRQEYEGSFESYEGRAYVYYDSEKHRTPQSFESRIPVWISCDFNLNPCLWTIGQDKNGFISIQEEIKQRQTDIWRMRNALKERLAARIGKNYHNHPIVFYGDYEHGKTRSVSATHTSWSIIKDEFVGWKVDFKLKSHPRIIDRVNAFNSKLRNAKGEIQLGIDPMCIELHKDLEMVSMEMLQSETEKAKNPDRTHASDGVGYMIEYEYPVGRIETRVY